MGALAELAGAVLLALFILFAPLFRRIIGGVLVFLLFVVIFGSPSEPLWYVAVAIISLIVILFVIRKSMQG